MALGQNIHMVMQWDAVISESHSVAIWWHFIKLLLLCNILEMHQNINIPQNNAMEYPCIKNLLQFSATSKLYVVMQWYCCVKAKWWCFIKRLPLQYNVVTSEKVKMHRAMWGGFLGLEPCYGLWSTDWDDLKKSRLFWRFYISPANMLQPWFGRKTARDQVGRLVFSLNTCLLGIRWKSPFQVNHQPTYCNFVNNVQIHIWICDSESP